MKKLRNIFAALSTLRRIPSTDIAAAWTLIKSNATFVAPDACVNLIDSIIDAVVAIAKDDEDKATAAGKADKP